MHTLQIGFYDMIQGYNHTIAGLRYTVARRQSQKRQQHSSSKKKEFWLAHDSNVSPE